MQVSQENLEVSWEVSEERPMRDGSVSGQMFAKLLGFVSEKF